MKRLLNFLLYLGGAYLILMTYTTPTDYTKIMYIPGVMLMVLGCLFQNDLNREKRTKYARYVKYTPTRG